MSCKEISVNNIVRSAAIIVVGLPVSLGLANVLGTNADVARTVLEESKAEQVVAEHKDELIKACIDFRLSKVDTKLERQAKTAIDEYFDGEVDYNNTCRWVLS